VPGATVELRQGDRQWTVYTNLDGLFEWPAIPPGPVNISVRMFGFEPAQRAVAETGRSQPVEVALSLRAAPTAAAAAAGRAAAQPADTAAEGLELQVRKALDTSQVNGVANGVEEGTESFLVQGSLSRIPRTLPDIMMLGGMPLSPEQMDALAGIAGMFFGQGGPGGGFGGPGAFGGGEMGGGGFEGQAGGFAGGGPGGFGGGRGGFGGGPGGGGPGGGPGGRPMGPGMGPAMGPGIGPGMRPGMSGPMGQELADRIAKLSPQKREKFVAEMRQRFGGGRRGPEQVAIGNRQRRARDQLRGGANLTLRNSLFDAAPYSLNGQQLQNPDYSQNRYGFTIGGPLILPKLPASERTTFFVNYGGVQGHQPFSSFSLLPGAAERQGDFSQTRLTGPVTIYDGRLPFPENRIPASRISPTAAGLLKLIPEPNQTVGVQNFRVVTSIPQDTHNLSLRLNRSLNRRDRLAFSGSWQWRDSKNVQPYGFEDRSEGRGKSFDASWTRTVRRGMIFTSRARYNVNQNSTFPYFSYGEDTSGKLGIQGNSRTPVYYGPPNLNFTNYGDLTDGAYSGRRVRNYTYTASLSLLKGTHTYSFGVEFQRAQWNTLTESNARGTLFFGGLATSLLDQQGRATAGTGFDFADFLLGRVQSSSIRLGGADTYLRASNWSFFLQDEWRARRNLSFNLGVRYQINEPYSEKYRRMANLDIAPGFTAVAVVTPGAPAPYSGGYFPAGLMETEYNNIAPRIGIAWRPSEKRRTTLRAGYSIFYDNSIFTRTPSRLTAQPPFAQSANFNSSVNNVLTLQQAFFGPRTTRVNNSFAVARHYPLPYAQTWSASWQQDVLRGLVLEVTYLATKGTRLGIQRQPNRAAPGAPLTAEERRQIGNAVSFTFDSPEGNSIFHSGQVRLSRRLSRGMNWSASYIYGKSIDNATSIGGSGNTVAQDDRNFAAERGLSQFDRRHQFSLNGMFSSPFGPNGTLMRRRNAASSLLKNWNLTTSITANAGGPLTARASGNVADSSGSGVTGSSRADATGLPIGAGTGYFNTLAFRAPLSGTFGNAGRNTIPGPGQFVINATFGRQFEFKEGSRQRLEVRAESSNLLNKVNISGLGTVVNALDYGLATRAGNMRSISLSLRYRF
jgi:hypothetical protein